MGRNNHSLTNVAEISSKTFLLSQLYFPACYLAFWRLHQVIMFLSNTNSIPSCCQEETLQSTLLTEQQQLKLLSESSLSILWQFVCTGDYLERDTCVPVVGWQKKSSDNILPEQKISGASHNPWLGKAVDFFCLCHLDPLSTSAFPPTVKEKPQQEAICNITHGTGQQRITYYRTLNGLILQTLKVCWLLKGHNQKKIKADFDTSLLIQKS